MLLLQRPSDGRILTVRHQPSSSHAPNLITVVGGHLEAGEFAQEAARRELLEETGVTAAPGTHRGLVWVDPGHPPADCHPYTRAVLDNFVAGNLYVEITAPGIKGGEVA
ncbi:NUDIX domain-containing protein [Streptomyces sp. NPDC050738]|uniref:NUDIX hydrolase n=1 Tax=Streptomyces sp. NPDC050738 TaxID=3154744 RepID=UPI0034335384